MSTATESPEAAATGNSWLQQSQAVLARLQLAQTRLSQLTVTPNPSARQLRWQSGPVCLYQYTHAAKPLATSRAQPPLLVVFALVNRADILDLMPEVSLIQSLVAQGRDVWLLDWGYPTVAQAEWGLDTYVTTLLPQAIAHIGAPVDLLGVCQGGTFALLYSALYPAQIRRLVMMIATIDFHTEDNLLTRWAQKLDVAAMVQQHALIPHGLLAQAFNALQPIKLQWDKIEYLLKHADDARALAKFKAIEQWLSDGPAHVGRAFGEYVSAFYQHNGFMQANVTLAGQRVDLTALRCPVMGIYARFDHITPLAGARALQQVLPQLRVAELEVPTGHIGTYVSAKARWIGGAIAQFLS
jgi:polyhydroxyalkanoate synthase subunit PhaC